MLQKATKPCSILASALSQVIRFYIFFNRASVTVLGYFCLFFPTCCQLVPVWLSVAVQVTDCKDSYLKWPIMFWWGRSTLLRSERITPLLCDLHWLRVPERIQFRLCVLAFRCLNGSAPPYRREHSSDSRCRRSSPPPLIYHHDACCPVSAAINSWWPCLSYRCIAGMEQPTTCRPNCLILHLLSAQLKTYLFRLSFG